MAVYLHEMLSSLICFLCFFWDVLKSWVEQVVFVVQSFSPKKMESERNLHLFQRHILIIKKHSCATWSNRMSNAFQTNCILICLPCNGQFHSNLWNVD